MTDSNKTKFQQNVRFNAITPEGMLVECETLFTFKNTETGRSYAQIGDDLGKRDEMSSTVDFG